MELTGNLATDEKLLREAACDLARDLLSVAPFDFPPENVYSRRRYIRDLSEWLQAVSIVDPDTTEPAPEIGEPDNRSRTMRLVTVETEGSDYNRRERVWNLVFAVKVGYGFTDERPENRGNSYDELQRVVYTLLQHFLEDATLGFTGANDVDVYRARHVGTRFVPSDSQGRPAHVADLQVFATVEVC
jgi:hypothetical protein